MKAITKSDFKDILHISDTTLRTYTNPYKKELETLRQRGNSFNYKVVLFLCWKLVIDPIEVYPKEEKESLINEQTKVLTELYGKDQKNW